MEIRDFEIDGPFAITPHKIEDERGYFSEIFDSTAFLSGFPMSSSFRTISR